MPLDCDDANVCTKDFCDPVAGCQHVPADALCDDGNWCTTQDECSGGKCAGGPVKDCNDSNPCTDDVCDPGKGCVNLFNVADCDDGNGCTVSDKCSNGKCEPGGPLDCDDKNVCTKDSCHPNDLCKHEPVDAVCDDGNACTTGDKCAAGKCSGGPAPNCDDNVKCTQDSCDPLQGCLHSPIVPCCGNTIVEAGEECDDGNANNNDGCDDKC